MKSFCEKHTKKELFKYGYEENVLCIGKFPEYDLRKNTAIFIDEYTTLKLFGYTNDLILYDSMNIEYKLKKIHIKNTTDECKSIINKLYAIHSKHKRVNFLIDDLITDIKKYFDEPIIETNQIYLLSSILLLSTITIRCENDTFSISDQMIHEKNSTKRTKEIIALLSSDNYEISTIPKTRDTVLFHKRLHEWNEDVSIKFY